MLAAASNQHKNLVIGNWKLHGSKEINAKLLAYLKEVLGKLDKVACVICPPHVYLEQVQELIQGSNIVLGAQNVSDQESGAFTGEVSAAMLVECGCRYVIIGHMERRSLYREDNALIARKYVVAKKAELTPILCVGETLNQRNEGNAQKVITEQLQACIGEQYDTGPIIAYEPGWAIGTGQSANPEQILEMHRFISDYVNQSLTKQSVLSKVVYGGSIKADNAHALFSTDYVNGGLVGGASLDAKTFSLICQAACDTAA